MSRVEAEVRCSEVCTRSGVTALLLAGLTFLLIPIGNEELRLSSLKYYANLRITLADVIEALNSDECWRKLGQQRSLETYRVSEIVQLSCRREYGINGVQISIEKEAPAPLTDNSRDSTSTVTTTGKRDGDSRRATTRSGSSTETRLDPPQSVRVSLSRALPYAENLLELMVRLADEKVLNRAQEVSPRIRSYIFRWERNASAILQRRNMAGGPPAGTRSDSPKVIDMPPEQFRGAHRNTLVSVLTLGDILDISAYELQTISTAKEVDSRSKLVNIPGLTIDVGLGLGSVVANVFMLVSIVYFMLYFREASRGDTFPAPGTLFSVAQNGIIARGFFVVLSLVPAASTVTLTLVHFRNSLLFYVVSILMVAFSFRILLMFFRGFRNLKRSNV